MAKCVVCGKSAYYRVVGTIPITHCREHKEDRVHKERVYTATTRQNAPSIHV